MTATASMRPPEFTGGNGLQRELFADLDAQLQ